MDFPKYGFLFIWFLYESQKFPLQKITEADIFFRQGLDGSSEYAKRIICSERHRRGNKCRLPISVQTCATCSELPIYIICIFYLKYHAKLTKMYSISLVGRIICGTRMQFDVLAVTGSTASQTPAHKDHTKNTQKVTLKFSGIQGSYHKICDR